MNNLNPPLRPHEKPTVIITYNDKQDLLWIGLWPANDEHVHAKGEIFEVEENTLVTVNNRGTANMFVSSIAITRASVHPLWVKIFRGLEMALHEKKRVDFSIDASNWTCE